MVEAKAEVLLRDRVADTAEKMVLSDGSGLPSGTEAPPTPKAARKSKIARRMQSVGQAYFDADAEEQRQKSEREGEDTNVQAGIEVQAAPGEKQLRNSPNGIAEAGRDAPSSSKGKSEGVPSSSTVSIFTEAAEEGDVSIETTSRTFFELTQWKKLLDEGILSQREFDERKQRYVWQCSAHSYIH